MHAKGSILLLLFLFLLKAPSYGGPFYAPEYDQDKFESIFIANLIKLVDYPESKNKELKLLVLTQNGDSRKFYSQLRKDLHKERIQTSNGRYFDIEVSRQATLQDLHNFDIVLVTNEFNIGSKKILEATRNKSILIIGENREFMYSMLNLLAYGTGGRFELNEELLTSRGFKASDKLKTLATTSREQFQNKVSEIEDSMSQIYLDKMKTDRELASKSQIIGDLEKSNQENLERSEELQDSLDLTSQLAKLQKERVDNQSELIKKQDKIMNQQRYLILISIIAVVLVLAFLFFVYSSRGKIKRQNEEISEQKEQLLVQNKEIIDSISYSKRIQSSILPPRKLVKSYLYDSFILYKPKDIVAGDFYWLDHKENKTLFAVCDCTGHGVPGAMVSVICNNGLNRSVRDHGLTDPGLILDKTRAIVVQEFEKSEEDVKDGMDIALVTLEEQKSAKEEMTVKLQYAGANNPLWIIRKGYEHVEEIKANKQPIGKFEHPLPYQTHELMLKKGDTLYIFSDGYADQFGGEKEKKFKTPNLKKLLLSIQGMPMNEQETYINNVFEKWKGNLEQIDDVCMVGIRI